MSQHSARLPYHQLSSKAFMGLVNVSETIKKGPLGTRLAELVFLRVSQINGCAYCMDMHSSALVKAGVESRKLHTLAGWRDSRFFDAREGAALAWAEQLTTLPSGAPADSTYEALKEHFDEHGIAELTMAIATINAWNRLGVGMQPILA